MTSWGWCKKCGMLFRREYFTEVQEARDLHEQECDGVKRQEKDVKE